MTTPEDDLKQSAIKVGEEGIRILKKTQPFSNIVRSEQKCIRCGQGVFFIEYSYAYCMGHIYSKLGIHEFFISKMCEWCYDEVCDIEAAQIKESNE